MAAREKTTKAMLKGNANLIVVIRNSMATAPVYGTPWDAALLL